MKIKILIVMLCVAFFSSGCSTLMGAKELDPDYAAYAQTMQVQFQAARDPLVNIQLSDEGKITGIVVNQPTQFIQVQQKKDHPGYALAGSVVKVAGVVGSIFAVGDALEGVIEASTGNETYMNSYNNNSQNEGTISSQSDYATTKTETFDAEVTTAEQEE